MRPWTTDMDGLCIALRLMHSRAEAVALVKNWPADAAPMSAPRGIAIDDEECGDERSEEARQ